ncbi:hypothetical protein K456DRAFT_1754636 [Colletotrichum gloeosporioides 23]|nr:hypothetical protein K456DRAFT_1754636 [Colletotrichum gloeosporioides 23]
MKTTESCKAVFPRPARRIAGQRQDVWSIINYAAAKSMVVNTGQGFFIYNPPEFIMDAAKEAVTKVDSNQYWPTTGRPSLKRAIAESYSEALETKIDPDTEVNITTGANEDMNPTYISNIEMAGGEVRYVSLNPPRSGNYTTSSSADWVVDMEKVRDTIMGKVFSRSKLEEISQLCVENKIIILSDEVYDSLHYVPVTRVATLSQQVRDLTLTVGSAGKSLYATAWRIGFLVGPQHLIKHVSAAHTRVCYSSPSPLQEACATGYAHAGVNGFWGRSRAAACKARSSGSSRLRFLIMELGIAAIPPTEFSLPNNSSLAENYLRFTICKEGSVLENATERLRGLKKYIEP